MKKVILFAAFAVVGFASQAQVTFGGHAGINVGSQKTEYSSGSNSVTQTTDSKVGLTIGAVAELPISSGLFFRPELNFTQKGGKSTDTETFGGTTLTYKNELTANYLELPLNVVYKLNAGSGNVLLGAGPSLGFGFGGKAKLTVSDGTTSQSESADVKFDGKKDATDDNVHYKSFDFGANVMAGYQLSNGLFFKANYSLGLANISPEDNTKTKNRGFGFTVGYMFGGSSSSKD
jgi:hypothetical protein